MNTRQIWVDRTIKIAYPVLYNLANNTLKVNMPMKKHAHSDDRQYCTYLEAVGRTLCGFTAWFEAEHLEEDEQKLRDHYLKLTIRGLKNGFDETSPDFLYTKKDDNYLPQVLVDTAFLALGLMRAKTSLWEQLDQKTRQNIIKYFKETRDIQPWFNNWLLFSCMVEAFFHAVGEPCDMMRIDFGIKQMEQWYVGDGQYKDGKEYHVDYYNSFVIHPFLIAILEEVGTDYRDYQGHYTVMRKRAQRYAKVQEMAINTDGTFCAVGRSIVYRCGAFHHLAHMARGKALHEDLTEAGVRCALTAMITRCIDAPHTFDEAGWLNIGLYGNQPDLGESYISIGSLYLCTFAFLPLGLDADDTFWTDADAPYTMQKIWSGMNVAADHALYQ
ncbi:MAG: DUF2264 domain-containing protein [Cellulosilyticaceae bacterium]